MLTIRMKTALLSLLLLTVGFSSQAQYFYPAGKIQEELKEDAHTVIREYSEHFEVSAPGKGVLHRRGVVTILDSKSWATDLSIYYDSQTKVGKFKAKVYNSLGQEVRKYSAKDLEDYSAISDFSIYEDDRVKHVKFFHPHLPFTVEYEYEVFFNDIRYYPSWYVQYYHTAIERASFRISLPEDLGLSYKSSNCELIPREWQDGSTKHYEWRVEQLAAIKAERMAPPSGEVLPRVYIAPHHFEIDGYEGSMADWRSYGKFMYRLNAGRDQLSPEMAATVKRLTARAQNDQEKIAILYRYLQENTRYVSVQLGIGGWQTFDANYVEKNKYGDCKALTNFMKSMLKEVGITAHATLINSGEGEEEIPEDIAWPGFNHVVLYVPSEHTWLECTSNHNPPNYLGSSNADRNALLIASESSKLIRTPKLTSKDNFAERQATIQITEDGAARIEETSVLHGQLQEVSRYVHFNFDLTEQKSYYQRNSELPNFNFVDWQLEVDAEQPIVKRSCAMEVPKYVSKAGPRLFVPLNRLYPFQEVPKIMKNRQFPIDIEHEYTVTDAYVFELSESLRVESYPEEPIVLESDFGQYRMEVRVEGQKVYYQRKLVINSGQFPPERYADLRSFYKSIARKDGSKIVLNKK
ncbi:MAG: DUF3857 and transglutaminase domain-containing protein [Bacteroidota bacterium]